LNKFPAPSPAPLAQPISVAPYAGLTPDCILDALDSVGQRADGRLIALNSYENRVYQIYLESGEVIVAKFYRPQRWSNDQILEEHAFAQELSSEEVPVVAPMLIGRQSLFEHAGFRFALFKRMGGRAPELDAPEVLGRIGGFLGRIHAVGSRATFKQRLTLDVAGFGTASRDYLLASELIPIDLRPAWSAAAEAVLVAIRSAFEEVGTVNKLRIHGDCHIGNILWSDSGAHLVDLDDCVSGPAIQDFWMLLSGDAQAMALQLDELLEGYEQFCRFDPRELRLLEALRGLRLLHYSAWLARRWNDPAFLLAFPWFNSQRYWQDRILELREQIGALSEPALRLFR
jgi:Ser/Thr protein kinase RdoA (MazF antagonist)